jgi:hypothetical protein
MSQSIRSKPIGTNIAFERLSDNKIRGEGLDVFVDTMMKSFARQIAVRNAADELRFQTAVLEEDLPLEAQLEYRKEQLKRVSDDPEERKRVRLEVATLKQRIEQKKFADDYTGRLINNAAGITSLDSTIEWLRDQLASNTNESIKDTIRKQLVEAETKKFDAVKDMMKNRTEFAVKDKTLPILDEQINRVSGERSKALLAGNNELVSIYDLQLQSLNRSKTEASIENNLKNFAVSNLSGYSNAVSLLDGYNKEIANAATTGAVKIGEITYASPREYWTYVRDSYIADRSSSGFFARLEKEQTDLLKTRNSQNVLTVSDVRTVGSVYDSLNARPELLNYQNQIATGKQLSMQSGADLFSQSVLNKYTQTLDVNTAVMRLNELKGTGVNVEDTFTKLLTVAANIASTQQENIYKQAQLYLAENPDLGISGAVTKAVASGVATVQSPQQAVTTPPEAAVKTILETQKAGTAAPDTRTTTPPVTVAPVIPPIVPQQAPAQPSPTPISPFTRQLDLGATGADVKSLQQFLNKQGFAVAQPGQPGSAGFETEYFGPATQKALQQFQAAQGIVSTGDPLSTGYGRVGPATLKKLNELYK